MHRIPMAHAFCNGLVKGFWGLMSRNPKVELAMGNDIILSPQARKNIAAKVADLRGTSCFTSAMPDIVKYAPQHGHSVHLQTDLDEPCNNCCFFCSGTNCTMEDKLTWADTVSAYALHEAGVDERILEMWGHLRKATVFFMRYQHGQHQEEFIAEAQDALFQYTSLVQENFGMNELLTFQLHTCLAHVAEQARKCGATAFAGEWWLERCMQVFKRITKYRSTRHPECVGTNHFLAVQALNSIPCRSPTATKLLDVISPSERSGRGIRDDTSGSNWLVGSLEDLSDNPAEVSVYHCACRPSCLYICTLMITVALPPTSVLLPGHQAQENL